MVCPYYIIVRLLPKTCMTVKVITVDEESIYMYVLLLE